MDFGLWILDFGFREFGFWDSELKLGAVGVGARTLHLGFWLSDLGL